MRRLRLWHWLVISLLAFLGLLLLWLVLAYGELPHLWSKHEHKKIRHGEGIVSYTSQDIPADPINLQLIGDANQVKCAFTRGGWSLADPLSGRSALGIVGSVVLQRAYPQAPVPTTPQVYIAGERIGGCTELEAYLVSEKSPT